VFDLKDGFGYYFFDAQKAPAVPITTGSASWNGRIVGSDNGDANKYATQSTSNDSPVGDGFKVTFADNTDHLDIPSTSQAGWQVVGTSLGTFAYKVNATAVTELNLLGRVGHTAYRKTGDLYGIILLPASATGADIEQSRKLLIDRGAADGASGSNYYAAWFQRFDIVEFQNVSMATPVNLNYAFSQMSNLVSFPAMTFTNTESLTNTWELNTSMSVFGAIQAPLCSNFFSAWKSCSALTSFPADAKLGTNTSNVNFTEAWRSSGLLSFNTNLPTGQTFTSCWRQSALTSFGAIDLSAGTTFTLAWQQAVDLVSFGAIDARNGTTFQEAWKSCSALTDFSGDAKLGTEATNVNFMNAWINSGLTSFPALDLSTGSNFTQSWYGNSSLTDFSGDAKLGTAATNVNFTSTWRESGLESFPALDLSTGNNFREAFQSCTALTTIEDGILLGTASSSVDFTSAFKACMALTTLPANLDLSKGDDFQTAFQNCQSLVDFPANAFDTMGTPQDYCFLNTWLDNNALSATSVENILVSINTSGQSAPSTGPEITIKYNTATGTPAYSTLASLKSKGWVIIVNGVTL